MFIPASNSESVSAAYEERATSHLHENPLAASNGFFSWRGDLKVGDKTFHCTSGRGAGGQFILMLSQVGQIIVVPADHKGMGTKLATMPKKILPAFIQE